MSDSSRSIPHDIEIGNVGTCKKNIEWLEGKLTEVDINLQEEGYALLEKIYGDARDEHTIFKRKGKADDREPLEPRAVSIGPYHHNCRNQLTFGNDHKLKITRFMVRYCSLDAKKYLEEMEKNEKDVRKHYDSDLPEWKSEEFRTMLLLDSSFILFVMDAFCNNPLNFESRFMDSMHLSQDRNAFMEYTALSLHVREHSKQIKLDLLTVDNQIPFLAIKLLLGCFPKGSKISKESIERLALWCFIDIWPMVNKEKAAMFNHVHHLSEEKMNDEQVMSRGVHDQFHHVLHFFHWSRIPTEGYKMGAEERAGRNVVKEYIPSATELQKSAIKFKKKDSGSYVDITFNRGLTHVSGVINIPVLKLYDYSKTIFRNLIVFEATPINNVLCFTAYTACMSCILQGEDDVKLLRESGIVASTNYKDAHVVDFFAKLNEETENIEMPSTLLDFYDDVTDHHESRISKWWGNFMLQYCPNFWVALSLVAAVLIFILSFLQTIYGMLSYYVPEKK